MPTFECPTCRKSFAVDKKEDAPSRPFCSQRCKQVDLGKWLDGSYCVWEPDSQDMPNDPKLNDE